MSSVDLGHSLKTICDSLALLKPEWAMSQALWNMNNTVSHICIVTHIHISNLCILYSVFL